MLQLYSEFGIIPTLHVSWEHETAACYSQGDYFQQNQTRGEKDTSFQTNTHYIQLCCKHEADIVYNARCSRFPSSSAKTRDFPLDFLDKRLPPVLPEEARARTQSILYYRVDNFLQNHRE